MDPFNWPFIPSQLYTKIIPCISITTVHFLHTRREPPPLHNSHFYPSQSHHPAHIHAYHPTPTRTPSPSPKTKENNPLPRPPPPYPTISLEAIHSHSQPAHKGGVGGAWTAHSGVRTCHCAQWWACQSHMFHLTSPRHGHCAAANEDADCAVAAEVFAELFSSMISNILLSDRYLLLRRDFRGLFAE